MRRRGFIFAIGGAAVASAQIIMDQNGNLVNVPPDSDLGKLLAQQKEMDELQHGDSSKPSFTPVRAIILADSGRIEEKQLKDLPWDDLGIRGMVIFVDMPNGDPIKFLNVDLIKPEDINTLTKTILENLQYQECV